MPDCSGETSSLQQKTSDLLLDLGLGDSGRLVLELHLDLYLDLHDKGRTDF